VTAIDWNKQVVVDLGGGLAPRPGHINVDLIPQADVVHDLNTGLPKYWPDDSVSAFFASHVIEHLESIIPLMNDVYRVLKPGCAFEISTPLAGTTQYWQDPTHKHGFVPESFLYFSDASPFGKEQAQYGITARFIIARAEAGTGVDAWQLFAVLRKQPVFRDIRARSARSYSLPEQPKTHWTGA
jgi:hypothetical protein